MVAGNIVGGRIADKSVMGTIYWVLPGIAVALVVYAVAVHWPWSAFVMVFVVGGAGSLLVPALQTRLLDASPDAPSLASSLNHAALNVANALGAFLGGLVIAWGWGYVAPALVGAVLAILGLGVAVISGLLERKRPLVSVACREQVRSSGLSAGLRGSPGGSDQSVLTRCTSGSR